MCRVPIHDECSYFFKLLFFLLLEFFMEVNIEKLIMLQKKLGECNEPYKVKTLCEEQKAKILV